MDSEVQSYNEWAKRITNGDTARQTAKLAASNGQLALFQNFSIRRVWHNEEWYYSCVDCMVPLSHTTNPSRYWMDLKKDMLYKEEIDVYAIGVSILKLPDKNGRMQASDCANQETLLRIIQSIMSPHANDFKAWLARIGKQRMDDAEERAARRVNRARLDQYDRELHELAETHGVIGRDAHDLLTDACWSGLYDVESHWEVSHIRSGYPDMAKSMGSVELAYNSFQRAMTSDLTQKQNLQGVGEIASTARDVGQEIREMIERMGATLPEDLPQYPPLPPGEWMPDNHPNRIQWGESA